ncbi:MAG: TetR/AcrR family transcriptional regulator [Firmicutes bacterium]|nr:TetR/AcrR family transcriptional regulator [Bacillota bacterium]
MEKNIDLRVKRTYKLLSDALIKLMGQKPFEKITITDICNEAMIHRTTFYTHFDDKYALLRYTMSTIEDPYDSIEVKEKTFSGYKHYYMKIAENTLAYINKNIDIFRIFLKKNREDSFITYFHRMFSKKLEKRFYEAEKSSGISLPVPVPVLANLYSGGCISVIVWWIENDMPCSTDDLLEYLNIIIRQVDYDSIP